MSDDNKEKLLLTHYKKCSINGCVYNSIKEASEKLNLSHSCLGKRLRSNNPLFENYFFV